MGPFKLKRRSSTTSLVGPFKLKRRSSTTSLVGLFKLKRRSSTTSLVGSLKLKRRSFNIYQTLIRTLKHVSIIANCIYQILPKKMSLKLKESRITVLSFSKAKQNRPRIQVIYVKKVLVVNILT